MEFISNFENQTPFLEKKELINDILIEIDRCERVLKDIIIFDEILLKEINENILLIYNMYKEISLKDNKFHFLQIKIESFKMNLKEKIYNEFNRINNFELIKEKLFSNKQENIEETEKYLIPQLNNIIKSIELIETFMIKNEIKEHNHYFNEDFRNTKYTNIICGGFIFIFLLTSFLLLLVYIISNYIY